MASASSASAASSKPAGDTLRVAVPEPPDPFDPGTLQDNRSIGLAENVFTGLTAINSKMQTAPGLAKSYTVSSNGKTYTFHLRPGAKFENGDPITAADFVYSWNRALSPKTAGPDAFFLSGIEGASAVQAGKAKAASGIKAVGNATLKVTLAAPAGYFPDLVSTWPAWVVDPKVVQKYGSQWDAPGNIVGSGAYSLTSEVGNTNYGFTSNPLYYGGKPSISKVNVSVVADPSVGVARFQSGEFDEVFGLDAAALREVNASSTLSKELHEATQLGTTWMGMLNTKAPFNNAKVREAFSEAINRKSLISVALDGLGHSTGTFLPKGLPGAIANTSAEKSYGKYSPTDAKKLLSEAGYPNGKGFPSVTLYSDNLAADATVVQFIQGELSNNLGVNISIRTMPQNSFQALFSKPSTAPSLYLYSFSLDYPDAQEMLQYFATSGADGFVNYEGYHNPAFDSLINKATATTNATARAKLYTKAEKMFMSTTPVVPLYNQVQAWLAKPYTHGIGQGQQYMLPWDLGSL